ncbi:hypothetical protein M3Y94_00453900 [Aphelenchoides besseyi]|nr:hypothetical protein M3Y94_00453900 [Aphelenchoides besseyi]KAI6229280.1 hypothetical protein M3Y95_00514400 [Aphelenchoides besseyi]
MRNSRPHRRHIFGQLSLARLYTLLSFLLILRPTNARSISNVGGLPRLQCMSCIMVPGDTTQLDQFRVRQGLSDPWCEMEPVECAPQQDTCVTVSMQVSPHRFWIGAGCDQRVNYDIPADRDGCVDLQTFTRSIQPNHVEERTAFQQVCICSDPLCNFASQRKFQFVFWLTFGSILFWILL